MPRPQRRGLGAAAAARRAAPPRRRVLPLLLLLAAACAAAQEPAVDPGAPQLLTSLPTCQVQASAEAVGVLPAGITPPSDDAGGAVSGGGCSIVLPQLARGEAAAFEFGVAPGSQMSLLFLLRARGGGVAMELFNPTATGGSADTSRPADANATQARALPAGSNSWLAVPAAQLAQAPGRYTLRLTSQAGSPAVEVVVVTPAPATVLDAGDRDALAALARDCCGNGGSFCTEIAPTALAATHPWESDLCHTPPNVCDERGRLVALSLRGAGLACPSFPPSLSALSALQRLDLSDNELPSSVSGAAAVLEKLLVQELLLSNTRLGGSLDCALVKPRRRVIDVSSNFLEGPLPACVLESPVEELDVAGNELAGPLPEGPYDRSVLVALSAGGQRRPKGGLTGPLPPALMALSTLQAVDLSDGGLSGPLQLLPPNAGLFNVSRNQLGGELPALPQTLWAGDFSANAFAGAIPLLSGLPRLEVLAVGSNALVGPVPSLPPAITALDASLNQLQGTLPPLPPSLVSLNVGGNRISGDISGLDVSGMRELRLGNNSFTGRVPATATTAKNLAALSLRMNQLTGTLPRDWNTPSLELLLLSDNQFSGWLPPALAQQPRLGTLRVEGNRLDGGLGAFASALPPEGSPLFHLDLSRNAFGGDLPDGLARLGAFSRDAQFVAGTAGGQVPFARVLNASYTGLSGSWPDWLLSAVPSAYSACNCGISVRLNGPDVRLSCPWRTSRVTDFVWQVSAQQGFTCWDGKREVPLVDYLQSPSNSASARPGDDGPIMGDSGPVPPLPPGASAGVAIGVIAFVAAAAALGYFVGYKRWWLERRARAFTRYDAEAPDEGGGLGFGLGISGGGGGGGGGGARGFGFGEGRVGALSMSAPPRVPGVPPPL
ncbi:hypothetical protein Rsub_12348 [Raphidocelis subcapitata]|uniref:Uncharacterized protein n=1 Tax=Raphidocelis subcapitata TaxID=307507 RepID=A0A2V0PKI7_9CHLO|nr:hypothetical protein Rsub_12348 [Raphidocelis subcapitata]|eukprot:GBF99542.1 hypothetical protein Rsub_12348 [Raphidocelis subcapitata]